MDRRGFAFTFKRLMAFSLSMLVFSLIVNQSGASSTYAAQSTNNVGSFASFFSGKSPNLLDSGWSNCPSDITWSVDVSTLNPRLTRVELARLHSAFKIWSDASGLNFTHLGVQQMSYDPKTHHLSAAGMPTRNHIAVSFMPASNSGLLAPHVYGFGMPSQVLPASSQIVGGVLVLKKEIVVAKSKSDPRVLDNLYLHELGHVLGLGHVDDSSQVMYPTILKQSVLGSGDKAGIRALTQSCTQDS